MFDVIREENTLALGGCHASRALFQRCEAARSSLARLLDVQPDELAWTQNTSTSNRLTVSSLPWGPGDRLALTATEHISTRILRRRIEQITGQQATVIPVGDGSSSAPEYFLEALDRLLTPDHRLLIMSHVSCLDGRRLPVAAGTRLAQARGVKVLIDGAQAVGQFPVDVAAIGPDFYTGSGHKWLLGPAGISYVYVPRRRWPEFHPNLAPMAEAGEQPAHTPARPVEIGTETMSLRLGLGFMIESFLRIGLENVEAQVAALTQRLRDGLCELLALGAFEVISPEAWSLSSGITSLRFPGWPAEKVQALIDRIWDEFRVVVKFQTDFAGIRISVAAFNSADEVDRLLLALRTLIPRMG
jgi:selenocysteine lyase/cysteine desulfurase